MSVNKFKSSNVYGNFGNYDLSGGAQASATFQRNVIVGGNIDISGGFSFGNGVYTNGTVNAKPALYSSCNGNTVSCNNNLVASAGYTGNQFATNFGIESGMTGQGASSVAYGYCAGQKNQSTFATAIGPFAAYFNQGASAVAVGNNAGAQNQGTNAIAMGYFAGLNSQGQNSIAIGKYSGYVNFPANSIMLNASGTQQSGVTGVTGCFYVNPIRNTGTGPNSLLYNPSTFEVSYGSLLAGPTGPGFIPGNSITTGNITQSSNTYVLTTSNIQSVNVTDTVSLFTNTTGNINIGTYGNALNINGNELVTGDITSFSSIYANNLAKAWNAGLLNLLNPLSTAYYLLGRLGISSSMNITGTIGGAGTSYLSYIDCNIHNVSVFGFVRPFNTASLGYTDIVMYYNAGVYYVYLKLIANTSTYFDLQVSGNANNGTYTYLNNPTSTPTTPVGTLQLSTLPNGSANANGSLTNYLANIVQMNAGNTTSSSATTGTLVVGGGVGIGGTLNVGGNVKVSGVLTASNGLAISNATYPVATAGYLGKTYLVTLSTGFVVSTTPTAIISLTSLPAGTYLVCFQLMFSQYGTLPNNVSYMITGYPVTSIYHTFASNDVGYTALPGSYIYSSSSTTTIDLYLNTNTNSIYMQPFAFIQAVRIA